MKTDEQPPIWLELAAALLVPSACFGFLRVFDDGSTVLPIVGAALLSSALAVLARRLRLPLALSALVSLGLLWVLMVNRYAPGTARFGVLPTGASRDALSALGDQLVEDFRELKSPVPPLQPFVAAAMAGAWILAFLTDWGAMRLRLAFEPVLPAGLLFVFTSVPPISAGTNLILPTVIFGSGVAAWAVSQRAAAMWQRGVWLASDRQRGPIAIATSGAVVASLAVITGAVLGGQLPGAGADPVYSFGNQSDSPRVVVSPYVNIRSRLVTQTGIELFTVAADEPSYWRIAGLDTYEDDIWKVAGDFSPQTGRLPGQREINGQVTEVTQDYRITALKAIWLPAAFAPSEILEATAEVTWNAENGSLTVSNDVETSDGVDYSLISRVPAFSVDELRASSAVIPADVAERYLRLPNGLTPQVDQLAREITAGATSRYDQARALQDHFRAYDYEVRLGPRQGDPVEQFLAERQGFCQQFAGTFALMARSLGIPARVATGFTWGDPVGLDPETGRTLYSVTGRHTHAWPEVYFDDAGWVAFEPTPGRGLPGAVSYTGVAARQDSLIQPDNPGGPTTTGSTLQAPAQPDDQFIDDLPQLDDPSQFDNGDEDLTGGGFPIPVPDWRLLVLLGIGVGYLVGAPLLLWFLRRRRRDRATRRIAHADAASRPGAMAQRVEVAWLDATEDLHLGYQLSRQPAETRTEYAGRLRSDRRIPSDEFQQLAERATSAQFYAQGVTDLQVDQAVQLAKRVNASMHERVPILNRLRRQLDPRLLLLRLRAQRSSGGRRAQTTTVRPDSGLDARYDEAAETVDIRA